MVKHANIAILGFGREGQSLLQFLQKRRFTQIKTQMNADTEIWVLDKNPNTRVPRGVPSRLGANYLHGLTDFDIVFRSPGVPYTLRELYRARCDGVTVTSATKLFFELAAPYRNKLIGVTGTKGKGTTSSLIAHILKTAGKKVILAGNIGKPMLDILPELNKADYVVLELSSFQLQDLPSSPHIAVVVDIFPDHQDEHKSLREYYGSKTNIGRWQKKDDAIFYFSDNPLSKSVAAKSPAKKIPISPRSPGVKKNFDMASAVAKFLGATDAQIQKAITSFKGLEHRLELVRSIRTYSNILQNVGISFVNDSAATNPVATAAAVRSFENPLILLAGGRDKGLSYAPLARAIHESKNVQMVILYGENRKKMYSQIARSTSSGQAKSKSQIEIKLVDDLQSAVQLAYQSAKSLGTRNYELGTVTILLSPASASFDQFTSYADRGEQFKKVIDILKP